MSEEKVKYNTGPEEDFPGVPTKEIFSLQKYWSRNFNRRQVESHT
jgi:hypothetical protein